MATVIQVASRKYKQGGVIYEIPYFAEDSSGYPNCASLKTLDVPHKVCRARVSGGSLTRIYAGLVPLTDARASARRRYVAGLGELAYMKGTYGVYTRTRHALTYGAAMFNLEGVKFSKRLYEKEAYNLFVSIRSTGGQGRVQKKEVKDGKTYYTTVQILDFDAPIGVYETHEWSLLLESGDYRIYWYTEFLGTSAWSYVEYPSDTPA